MQQNHKSISDRYELARIKNPYNSYFKIYPSSAHADRTNPELPDSPIYRKQNSVTSLWRWNSKNLFLSASAAGWKTAWNLNDLQLLLWAFLWESGSWSHHSSKSPWHFILSSKICLTRDIPEAAWFPCTLNTSAFTIYPSLVKKASYNIQPSII